MIEVAKENEDAAVAKDAWVEVAKYRDQLTAAEVELFLADRDTLPWAKYSCIKIVTVYETTSPKKKRVDITPSTHLLSCLLYVQSCNLCKLSLFTPHFALLYSVCSALTSLPWSAAWSFDSRGENLGSWALMIFFLFFSEEKSLNNAIPAKIICNELRVKRREKESLTERMRVFVERRVHQRLSKDNHLLYYCPEKQISRFIS